MSSGEITRLPISATHGDIVRAKAQRTVAQFAVDATEAAQLMMMLGIHPNQENEGNPAEIPTPPVMGGVQAAKPPSEWSVR